MNHVLVLDGNSVFHRAWHAYEATGMSDESGGTWAIHGFIKLLSATVGRVRPTHVVVAFDDPHRNHRKQLDPSYKAHRPSKAEGFAHQMSRLIGLLSESGISVELHEGMEADDVCASVAAACESMNVRCTIATSDRDALACVSETTHVLRLRNGVENWSLYGPREVELEYGVAPSRYVELSALRGDASDNLPGVKGVGPKTASKLLAESDLMTLLDDTRRPAGSPKWLEDSATRDRVRHNLKLMTLDRTLPVHPLRAPLPTVKHVTEVCVQHGFPGLSRVLEKSFAPDSGATAPSDEQDEEALPDPQASSQDSDAPVFVPYCPRPLMVWRSGTSE